MVGLDAEIVVSKTDQRTTAAVGEQITYIVTVRNEGPDDIVGDPPDDAPFPAAGAVFRDLIPDNLDNVTFTASATGGASGFLTRGFSANERPDFSDANKALLEFGDGGIALPAGSVITYVITGVVTAGPELVNTAQLGTTVFLRDPNFNPFAPDLVLAPIDGIYFSPNNQVTDRTTIGGTAATPGTPGTAPLTGVVVSIVASAPTAAEQDVKPGQFRIIRTGSTTDPLTVAFTVGGTATNGLDYESIGGVVVIPADSSAVDVPIVPIDDTLVEGMETVVLGLLPLPGYSVQSGVGAATVEILDNDVAASTTPTPTPTPLPGGSTAGEVVGGVLRLAQPTANTIPPESFQGLPTGVQPTFGFSGGFFNLSDGPDQVSLDRFQTGGAPIRGLSGNDFIIGTENPEDIAGNQGLDTIFGAGGNDILRGGAGSDSLDGGEGNDSLFGNMDNDTLLGDSGNDLLRGGQGDDVLFGGPGNDTLVGDFGQDFLTGGLGADLFVLRPGAAAATELARADVIVDFRADEGDRIGLAAGLNFNTLVFGLIELAIDNETQTVGSTTIREGANGAWLGIVRGLAPSFLQANPQLFQTAFI
ncbi:MAG: Calx-beta domain-containing protein [Pseudanabaenaceae cyanobacterium]